MMTVRLRLPGILAHWFLLERPKGPQPISRVAMRCWPWDCDVYRHMNNSRYLGLMDLGRYHFIFCSGLWREIHRQKAYPVMVRAEIDFRRSIRMFGKFVLESSSMRVGQKSVVVRQRFLMGEEVAAEAQVTITFVKNGRPTEVAPLLAPLGELVAGP